MARPKKRPKSTKRIRKKRCRTSNGAHGSGSGRGRVAGKHGAGGDPFDAKVLHLFPCEITYEPLPHASMKSLPADVDFRMQEVHGMVLEDPARALAEVEALHQRFPNAVSITNWLVVCWNALGREEEALRLAETLVAENPDYLFGRITLAELHLNLMDLAAADRILGDLKHFCALCPGRKVFHVSEVVSWLFTVGKFHLLSGNIDAAERQLKLLKKIEPEAPATRELARMLSPETGFAFRALAALKNLLDDVRNREPTGLRRGNGSGPGLRKPETPSGRNATLFEGGGVELEASEEEER